MSQFIYLSFRWITDLSIYSHSPTASLYRRFAPPRTLPRYRITNPTPQHSNRTSNSQIQRGAVAPGFLAPPRVLAKTGSAWDPGSGRRLSRRVSAGIPLSYNLQTPPQIITPSRIITSPRITTPRRIITNKTGNPRETRSRQRLPPSHVSMDTVSIPTPPIPTPVSSDRDVVTEVEIRAPADTPVAKETPIRKTPRNSLGTTNVVEQETQQAPDSNTPIATPFPRRSTRKFQAPDSDAQIPTPNNKPEKQYPKPPHNGPQVLTNTPSMTCRPRRSTRITPATKKTPLSKSHLQNTLTAVKSPIPPPTPPPFPQKKTRRSLRGSQDLPSASPANVSEVNKTPLPTPPPQGPKSNVEVVIKTPQPKVRARATRSSTRNKVNFEFEFSDGELD